MDLKEFLEKKHLSVVEFAHMADCSPRYLLEIMSGRVVPSLRMIRNLEHTSGGLLKLECCSNAKKKREVKALVSEQLKEEVKKFRKKMKRELIEKFKQQLID